MDRSPQTGDSELHQSLILHDSSQAGPCLPDCYEVADRLRRFACRSLPALNQRIGESHLDSSELHNAVVSFLADTDLVGGVAEILGSASPQQLRTVLLDLVLVERSLQRLDLGVPRQLEDATCLLAFRLQVPPCLTYELIVRSNPPSALRAFTSDRIGEVEKRFYRGHIEIENVLDPQTARILSALSILSRDPGERIESTALELLTDVEVALRKATEIQRDQFTPISSDDFAVFRKFLESTENHPGPSGLYSGNAQALRLFILGDAFPSRMKLIERDLQYFPSIDQQKLRAALTCAKEGSSLVAMARRSGATARIREACGRLIDAVRRDMAVHIGVVKQVIPEAFSTDIPGTAGQPISKFLLGGLAELKRLSSEFTEVRT